MLNKLKQLHCIFFGHTWNKGRKIRWQELTRYRCATCLKTRIVERV